MSRTINYLSLAAFLLSCSTCFAQFRLRNESAPIPALKAEAPQVLPVVAAEVPQKKLRLSAREKAIERLIALDRTFEAKLNVANTEQPLWGPESASMMPITETIPLVKQPWGYTLCVGKRSRIEGWYSVIPSVTWHDNCIYVSGGISSRYFYCFAAESGELRWRIQVGDTTQRDPTTTLTGDNECKINGKRYGGARPLDDGWKLSYLDWNPLPQDPSSAVLDSGICVFTGNQDSIYAVNQRNGNPVWMHRLGKVIVTPMIHEKKVYVSYEAPRLQNQPDDQTGKSDFAPTHILACLDLMTGKMIWQSWIDSDVMSAPVYDRGRVLVTTFAGNHLQFDAKKGSLLYAHRGSITSAPVVGSSYELLLTRRRDQILRNYATPASLGFGGVVQATVKQQGPQVATQEILERFEDAGRKRQLLFAQNATPYLGRLGHSDIGTETIAGSKKTGYLETYQGSRPVIDKDGTIYCAMNERLLAFSSSGKLLWQNHLPQVLKLKKKTHGFIGNRPDRMVKVQMRKQDEQEKKRHFLSPPALAHDVVIVGTRDGRLVFVNKKNGELRKVLFLGKTPVSAQVTVMHGQVFVPTESGVVHVVNLGKREYTGWPTWGGNMQHTNKVAY